VTLDDFHIKDLDLPDAHRCRIVNCLKNEDIHTLGDLQRYELESSKSLEDRLMRIPNMGKGSIYSLKLTLLKLCGELSSIQDLPNLWKRH
jgi:DNA-directed RNA polymerase alpha subunit